MKLNLFKIFAVIGICLLLCRMTVPVSAQTINQQNFSNVRVDELTDDQIRQYMAQAQAYGLTDEQLVQSALARGMSSTEVQKLQQRVAQIRKQNPNAGVNAKSSQSNGTQTINNRSGRSYNNEGQDINPDSLLMPATDSLALAEKSLALLKSKIFGADLFRNNRMSFEPNLRLATPGNYQIGPDDELLIDIYGYSEASYQLTVSPEGKINIPNAGVVQVGGLTIDAAISRIKSSLSKIYSGIRTGNTSVNVALGNIRSIKVILTGEAMRPGTYTLPSLATVFNALYASGGPTENGSFRAIEIIRAGKNIGTMDVYDFLLSGTLKNNIRLQDQDVIRIPTYKTRVEVVGQVKRPGIFEMLPGEKLTDLLKFTGDFTERAYRARIKVLKNTATERKISDVTAADFIVYSPESGDKFFVDEILDRFENRVTINGAVFRPGQYELSPGLTLSLLIKKAEGTKEDAFLPRGYITRLNADNSTQLISFDLEKIIAGSAADIPLQREDIISISSIFDLREEYKVTIGGQVRAPGSFKYADNMSLEDLIIQAGGFKEGAAPNRVEISRRVKNSDATSTSARTAEVFQVDLDKNLHIIGDRFVLQPFDIVSVRSAAGYETQRQVRIEGEVLYPGNYTLSRKDERISDLLKRAGGFTAFAFPEGASLQRPGPPVDTLTLDSGLYKDSVAMLKMQNQVLRSLALKKKDTATVQRNDYVGINMLRILEKPGAESDIFLEEGDILTIPKQLQTVKVSGQVLSPVRVIYSSGKGFKQYISNGGGFSQRALKRRSYVIYANGSVRSTRKILFFNNYPVIKPGAEIIVPQKAPPRRVSVGELVGITSGLASAAAIIVSLLR